MEKNKKRTLFLTTVTLLGIWLLLLCVFLSGYGVAKYFQWEYRPIVVVPFAVVLYLLPVITGGYLVWHIGKRKWLKLSLRVLYCIAAAIVSAAAMLSFCIWLPQEKRMDCGYIEIGRSEFLEATQYTYYEPRYGVFMKQFEWDAEHEIHLLEQEYGITFTQVPGQADGIRRYRPEGYPDIAVRIYSYGPYGSIDDFQYKVASSYYLRCYEESGMQWEYQYGEDYYEGAFTLVYRTGDDLGQLAQDASKLIESACHDPLFTDRPGWLSVYDEQSKRDCTLYFGGYKPFEEKGLPSDYFTDFEKVLQKLKEEFAD